MFFMKRFQINDPVVYARVTKRTSCRLKWCGGCSVTLPTEFILQTWRSSRPNVCTKNVFCAQCMAKRIGACIPIHHWEVPLEAFFDNE